jgi:hypothetical protein
LNKVELIKYLFIMGRELNFEEMSAKLKKRFPTLVIKDGIAFDSNRQETGKSFWLPNASDVTYTNKDVNTLYQASTTYRERNYSLEVYNKFNAWCNRYGWYASTESYTMEIFK